MEIFLKGFPCSIEFNESSGVFERISRKTINRFKRRNFQVLNSLTNPNPLHSNGRGKQGDLAGARREVGIGLRAHKRGARGNIQIAF
jgi:hypothetical protein